MKIADGIDGGEAGCVRAKREVKKMVQEGTMV